MPDSTPPKPQTREIASILGYGRDITRSYLGKLLEPQDKVLARKWFDYEVYEDLLRDDQVKSVFQQRRSAVVAREWEVTPGGDKRIDKQAADFIRDTLGRMGWDNVSDKMLFGVFYGYAIGECMWAREGDKIQLTTIKVRKQRRFKFDWDMKPRLITWANNYEGEALPEYKFWHYSTGADNDDDPYGLGLAHWLYWPTYFKRNGIKSWLKFLERFAQPTAKGTYGPGAEAAEKTALKQALQAFGEDAAVMVPEGVAIELIEAARSGTADYGGLCDRMDGAIAKIILSQTMTTDNGSSKSQAEVHNGVKLDVVKADADLIDASANNTWVKWLTDWNFPGAAYPRISRKLEDEENLNDRAARDKSLSEMGFRLTPEKVVEVYGDGYFDPASLEEETGDQPPLVSVLGVGGTEALVGFLTALSQMSLKRENAIATLTTVFGISQSDAEAMVPEDAAPEAAAPPASIDDAAALFSEAPPDLLKALEPLGQQFADALNPKLFGVLQSLDRAAGDGEFAESDDDAAIGRRFVEVLEFGDRPNDRAFAVLQVLDQSVEVDMLTFAETESNVAMEGAIGRRLLALIRPGVVDFASGGGKKCTKGLSCGGSCISKAKVCVKAMNPAQKKQYGEIVKAVKAGGEGADQALEDFKASLKAEGDVGVKPDAKKEQSGLATTPKVEEPKQSAPVNPNRDPDLPELDDPTDQDVADYIALKTDEFNSLGPKGLQNAIEELGSKSFMAATGTSTLDAAYSRSGRQKKIGLEVGIADAEEKIAAFKTQLKSVDNPDAIYNINQHLVRAQGRRTKNKKDLKKLQTDEQLLASGKAEYKDHEGWVRALITNDSDAAGNYAALKTGEVNWGDLVGDPETGNPRNRIKQAMASKLDADANALGISGRASVQEIKAAFKKAALKAHPDRGGSAEAFQKVNDAYERLIKTMEFAEYRECVNWQIVVFSEFDSGVVEFAEKKKCIKGLSCGGSCISATKVCVKALNSAQKKQYRGILKSVKTGGEGADQAMEDFKASLKPESVSADLPTAPRLPEDFGSRSTAEQYELIVAQEQNMREWRSSLTRDQRRQELEERVARQAEELRQEVEATRNQLRPSDADLAQAESTIKARIASGDLPQPKPHVAKPYEFNQDLDVPPDTLNMTGDRFFYDRSILSVSFDVNGSYDKGAVTVGNENKAGAAAYRYFYAKFEELPDGLILHNTPNQNDDAGAKRKKLYKRAGFGEADKNNNMYGVIKGGKLLPLTNAEAFALSDLNRQSENS